MKLGSFFAIRGILSGLACLIVAFVTVAFSPGAQATTPTVDAAGIQGHVIAFEDDAQSAVPISGAIVKAVHQQSREMVRVESAADGSYQLAPLAPGTWDVIAVAPGRMAAYAELAVHLGEAITYDFHLQPAATPHGALRGKVLDARTSAPIVRAFVYVYHPYQDSLTPWTGAFTNENGVYEIGELPEGTLTVAVRHALYEPQQQLIEINGGVVTNADFRLNYKTSDPNGTLLGLVKDAVTGAPIPDVYITISGIYTFAPIMTDEYGKFTFSLAPSVRVVTASKQGYEAASVEVTVISNQTTEFTIWLKPIGATLPAGIEGKVYDASISTKPPIAGAHVFFAALENLIAPGDIERQPPIAGQQSQLPPDDAALYPDFAHDYVRTNGLGQFSVKPLRPGAYVLIAWARGYHAMHKVVTLAPGQVLALGFALQPEEPVTQSGTIQGRVLKTNSGEPIAGAWVYYGPALANGGVPSWLLNIGADVPFVRTDDHGFFKITPVRPGNYHLLAKAEGFQASHEVVWVGPGEIKQLDFKLEPLVTPLPGSIAGRVVNAANGLAIPNARVYFGALFSDALPPDWLKNETSPVNVPYVVTDGEGRYVIEGLKPGTWYLLAQAESFMAQRQQVGVSAGQRSEAHFKLLPITVTTGVIEGRVTNGDSLAPIEPPIAGARVYYRALPDDLNALDERAGWGGEAAIEPAMALYVVTNAEGHYRIPNLRPGNWHLLCAAEGWQSEARVLTVEAEKVSQASFSLHVGSTQFGAVAGRVVDAVTSAPLTAAYVWVVPDGDIAIAGLVAPAVVYGQAVTDDDGNFHIEHIPAGKAVVFAAKDHYRTGRETVLVPADGTAKANLALQPIPVEAKGTLKGTVRASSAAEQPVDGAMVTLVPENKAAFDLSMPPDPNSSRITLTDANGQYAFLEIPVGGYQVWVTREGFLPAVQHVVIEAAQTTEANFLLEPKPQALPGSLSGRVTDAGTNQPLAGAWIRIEANNSTAYHSAYTTATDALGGYKLPRVAPGKYLVTAVARRYQPQSLKVEIVAGVTTELDFALVRAEETGAVTGVVQDALTNHPIAGALVYVPLLNAPLSANDLNSLWTRTDDQGKFVIDGVPAGQRTVGVLAEGYQPDHQIAVIMAGQSTELSFTLLPSPVEKSSTVEVYAVNAQTGAAMPGVKVHISLGDWIDPFSAWDPCWASTGADGRAMIENVPPGNRTVLAQVEGFRPVMVQVPLDESLPGSDAGVQSLVLSFELDALAGSNARAGENWALYR